MFAKLNSIHDGPRNYCYVCKCENDSRHRCKVQNLKRKSIISNSWVRGAEVRNKLLHHSDPGRPLGAQMKTVYSEE